MRVLLWNRANSREQPGGDTVQWEQTAKHLRELGVEVDLTTDPDPDPAPYAIVHLFNLSLQDVALPVAERAKAAGKKVALSTIWWDPVEAKYVSKLAKSRTLRLERWLLGRERGLARFRRWKASRRRSLRARADGARLLELSDLLLPNSVGERRMIERGFAVDDLEPKTAIVPNATVFTAPPQNGESPREGVVCVARIYPLKNQAGLIEALTGLDTPLTLIGDPSSPDYYLECQALARAHGRVTFAGQLDHDGLRAHYRRAAVHVLPSFKETTGLVSLEAANEGCTVVTTDRGPTEEYFGDEAYYCDPADPASLRSAVERALAEPRRVSRERLDRYTWERAALATEQAYRWLLDPAVPRPTSLDFTPA